VGLKNLVIPEAAIKVPGNDDLVVRGLGIDSVMFLVRHHRDALETLFNRAQDGELDLANAEKFALEMISSSGILCGMIIACGAGEPTEWQKAMQLPVTIQTEALYQIGVLTFAAEGGVEKFMQTVLSVMSGVAALPKSLA
jgi:hypothetical protein